MITLAFLAGVVVEAALVVGVVGWMVGGGKGHGPSWRQGKPFRHSSRQSR